MAYPQYWRELIGARMGQTTAGLMDCYRGLVARVPTHCPLCSGVAHGGDLCPPCRVDVLASMADGRRRCGVCMLALAGNGPCPDCLLLAPAYDRVIAAFDYAEPGDVLIQQFKTMNRFQHARFLASLLAEAVLAATPSLPGNTMIVCVPSSRAAVRQRGFNPAAEVARQVAGRLRLRWRPRLLVRRDEDRVQKYLSRRQRIQDAQHQYACTTRVDGAHIAVVDDVLTTGSTLHGIALQLRQAGAVSVCGLVLARAPYR